jgi:tetratricopeptide (TPR) repeat protein
MVTVWKLHELDTFVEDIKHLIEEGDYKQALESLAAERKNHNVLSETWRKLLFIEAETLFYDRKFKASRQIVLKMLDCAENTLSEKGEWLNLLGKIYRLYERYDDALVNYELALKCFKVARDEEGMSKIYHNQGNVQLLKGNLKNAQKLFERALDIQVRIKDLKGQGISYMNLGNVYYQNGEFIKALDTYQQATEVLSGADEQRSLAKALLNAANIYSLRNDLKIAEKTYEDALMIFRKQKDKKGMKIALQKLAELNTISGKVNNALAILVEIRELCQEDGDQLSYLSACIESGNLHMLAQEPDKAINFFQTVFESTKDDKLIILQALDGLGRAHVLKGDNDTARHFFEDFVNRLEKKGISPDLGAAQANLGTCLIKTGNYSEGLYHLEASISILGKTSEWFQLLAVLDNYYEVNLLLGNFEQLHSILQEYGLLLIKKMKDPVLIQRVYLKLAFTSILTGNGKKAEKWIKTLRKATTREINTFIRSEDYIPVTTSNLPSEKNQSIHQAQRKVEELIRLLLT